MEDGSARSGVARPRWRLALAASVIVLGWIALRTHQNGHDWGDDFALYIRQAQGVVDGFAHQIEADNRFSLQASGWSTFSPAVYPWGWPLLMTPVIALVGVDYEALKFLIVVLWCAALAWWFLVVRSRTAAPIAWVSLAALGFSWPCVVWTNSVVSDIPYLAAAFGCLWWIDRCHAGRAWHDGAWWPLVVLGAAVSFAFNIRRDGLALVAALIALLAVQVVSAWRAEGRSGCIARWRRWALPFASFAIVSSVLQILLPSVIQSYPGTGWSNIDDRVSWYHDILAEQLGLLAPDSDVISLLGSHRLGVAIYALIMSLAAIGLVARCIEAPLTDLPLAAFAFTHTAMVLIAPFQDGRYIFPIVPVLVYFALQSLPTLARLEGTDWRRLRRLPAIVTACLVAVLALSSARDTLWWADRAGDLRAQGAIVDGPTRPEAIEMARAVMDITAPDDVVAFFRARAMTMMTNRRSLQAGAIEPILAGADWYVMQRGSTYSQPLLGPDDAAALGLEEVWSNDAWVMFHVPHPLG